MGPGVGKWVYEAASKRKDAHFELIDLEDFNLPLLDEPGVPAMETEYVRPHTRAWAKKIESLDAFIFVTAEYNHGIPGALKNALDFIYKEWNDKVAGFVGYGGSGGVRAVEQLRLAMTELQVANVRSQLALSLRTDFDNYSIFKPSAYHEKSLNGVIDQVLRWGGALKSVRTGEAHHDGPVEKSDEGQSASLH